MYIFIYLFIYLFAYLFDKYLWNISIALLELKMAHEDAYNFLNLYYICLANQNVYKIEGRKKLEYLYETNWSRYRSFNRKNVKYCGMVKFAN